MPTINKHTVMVFLGGVLVTVAGLYAYEKLKASGILK